VGRIGKEKNHDFLLDVFSKLEGHLPDAMWLVVGDGPYRPELERRIRERGLEGRVVLTGYVPRDEVKHAFALADVFMFGSKTETQGLVTVEAMACGAPVVASRVASLPEVAGDAAAWVDPRSPESIAEGILSVLSHPARRAQLVERGLARARSFSWERTARETFAAYGRARAEASR
jgi:1,2-diacylglycerol 3-alpha-glucosyltransferase